MSDDKQIPESQPNDNVPAEGVAGSQDPVVTATNGVRGIRPPVGGAHCEVLTRATAAFQQGDFRQARALAVGVLNADPTDAERAFVDEVMRRTGMDVLALVIGLACLALFLVVVFLTFAR